MGTPSFFKNVSAMAAFACAFASIFVGVGQRGFTQTEESMIFYLLLAGLVFALVAIIARFVSWQRE